jgi:hypothetical protein
LRAINRSVIAIRAAERVQELHTGNRFECA